MSDSGGEASKQEPEPVPPAEQAGGAEESRGKKPRKVAKTLLFNTPEGGEKSVAQIKLEEAVKQAADQESGQVAGQQVVPEAVPEVVQEAASPDVPLPDVPAVPLIDEQQLVAQVQKRAARRVAKTLLFSSTNLGDLQAKAAAAANEKAAAVPTETAIPTAPAAPEVSAPDLAMQPEPAVTPVAEVIPAPRAPKRTRKIAKTLMESDLDNFAEENLSQADEPPQIDFSISAPAAEAAVATDTASDTEAQGDVVKADKSAEPAKPAKPLKRERQQFVAKTMLDHSILWDTVSKFEAKMEVKVAEQIAERAAEPVKMLVPIECKKQALACGFKWDDTETRERFRYCALCKTAVYNFAGLEMPEAEEIIFQRENKKKFTLFKRPDGKFMTVDCPVEVKRKRDTILLSVGGVVLVLCALAFMIYMPKPPKPEPQAQAVQNPVEPGLTGPGENRGTNSSSKHPTTAATGAAVNDGSFHMVNGQRVYPTTGTAPVTFPAPQQPAVTSDADENGDFWQYDGPPNSSPPVQPVQPLQPVPPVPVQPQQSQNSSFAPQQLQQQYPQPVTDVAVPKPTNGAQLKQAGETPSP